MTPHPDFFMQIALEEAYKGLGRTHPNPPVGAIIVKHGKILGKGFHAKAGSAHAEVNAVIDAKAHGENLAGAEIYVTLEPCNHTGKTPPCTQAILDAGIQKVIILNQDPNPNVCGEGAVYLKNHGVHVEFCQNPDLIEKGKEILQYFVCSVLKKRPFITLKIAASLDGKISANKETRTCITGKQSQKYVHRLRNEHDAILIGSSTARIDNPLLTVREYPSQDEHQPTRILLYSLLSTPSDSHIFNSQAPTIVFHYLQVDKEKRKLLLAKNVTCIPVEKKNNQLDIKFILNELHRIGFSSIFVEGGAQIFESFLRENLVDKLYYFCAPIWLGKEGVGIQNSLEILKNSHIKHLDPDIILISNQNL